MSLAIEARGDEVRLDVLTLSHRLTRAYENECIYTTLEIENDVTSLVTLHATNAGAAPFVETLLYAIEETQANHGIDEAAMEAAYVRGIEALKALIPFYPCTGSAFS